MKKQYKYTGGNSSTQSYQNGFGKHVEYSMNTMTLTAFPLCTPPTTAKMNAHLSTNEWIDDTFVITDELTNPLDGYIIGVGFGHIFKMIDLFPAKILPRAIICADVRPEVILVGRIIVKKLMNAKDKKSFFTSLYSITSNEIDVIIHQEEHTEISRRLLEAAPYIEDLFNNVEHHIEIGAYLTPSIVDIFNRNFDRLQYLARNNNIGVVLIDVTNRHFTKIIKNLPHYSSSRNIIYLSNAIDHITNRGINLEAINNLNVLQILETTRSSVCVDTTQQSLNYKLRIGTLPPKYCICDYPEQL